ncbi:MAG: HAD hydrolase family protein [Oscillospiraceae bacterium]|nr:HAD hydrolase family protein [Oscillospiraceae bacterium]
MKPFEGFYLYVDMDGTLLNSDKKITQGNLDAMSRFIDEGGKIGIASGRSPHNIDYYYSLFTVNAPSILFNGSAVYDFDTKQYLYQAPLNKSMMQPVIDTGLSILPDVCIQVFTEKAIYECNLNQGAGDPYLKFEWFDRVMATPDQIQENWLKLLFCDGDGEKIDRIQAAIDPAPFEAIGMTVTRSGLEYFEFLPTNKGETLRKLPQIIPDVRKTLAIGDYGNDLAMVEAADIGAAPANATDAVKSVADCIVADNDHDAVADFLEKAVFRFA